MAGWAPQASGDRRILVIEDDQAIAEMYALKLRAHGYAVTIANDGGVGLELGASLQPDLIYLDVGLPGMDGLEVLEKLQAGNETRHIPTLVVSNFSDEKTMDVALKLGAVGYLVKCDVTPALLEGEVERRVGRPWA